MNDVKCQKKLNFNDVSTFDTCHFTFNIKHYALNINRIWHCWCMDNFWVMEMCRGKVFFIILSFIDKNLLHTFIPHLWSLEECLIVSWLHVWVFKSYFINSNVLYIWIRPILSYEYCSICYCFNYKTCVRNYCSLLVKKTCGCNLLIYL
jgi:hypothetical protein